MPALARAMRRLIAAVQARSDPPAHSGTGSTKPLGNAPQGKRADRRRLASRANAPGLGSQPPDDRSPIPARAESMHAPLDAVGLRVEEIGARDGRRIHEVDRAVGGGRIRRDRGDEVCDAAAGCVTRGAHHPAAHAGAGLDADERIGDALIACRRHRGSAVTPGNQGERGQHDNERAHNPSASRHRTRIDGEPGASNRRPAQNAERPAEAGLSVIAGAGFEPATFGL